MAYTAPTVRDLVTRYPAFASVPISTVETYIADALASGVDESWTEADYPLAAVALAAHQMALCGFGTQTEMQRYAGAGVRSVRSGSFSVDFTDAAANRASGGGFNSTPYGRQYLLLLKRNRGGPRVVGASGGADGLGDYGGICNNGLLP